MEEKFKEIVEEYKKETEKECYKINIVEGTPQIEDDKIGGTPYLPIGEEYPVDKDGKKMALLIQVNLRNIDLDGYLKKGILEIFTNQKFGWPFEYKVKYFEEGLEYQKNLEDVSLEDYITTKPLKIELKKDIEHMPMSDYRFEEKIIPIVNKKFDINLKNAMDVPDFFEENGFDFYDMLCNKLIVHDGNIGGYADFTQEDPRYDIHEEKEECLVKIDSNLGHGIVIGDSGIIFAVISKEDIKNCNFEKALVDWDCC